MVRIVGTVFRQITCESHLYRPGMGIQIIAHC